MSISKAAFLAKENYQFLQHHSPYSKKDLRLDADGRLHQAETSSSPIDPEGSLQKRIDTVCIQAEIWGHLIPEVKSLRKKEDLSEADLTGIDALLGEIQKLRKENPFFIEKLRELLQVLERCLQDMKPHADAPSRMKAKLAVLGLSATGAALLVALYLHPGALAEATRNRSLFMKAASLSSLALSVCSVRSAAQTEGKIQKAAWNALAFVGLVGFCTPPIIDAIYK